MGRRRFILALLTGILLGTAFPPLPLGLFACVAFIPLFLLLDGIDRYSDVIRYGYLSFFVFNTLTLYWVGGFTHGNDKFLMLAGAALLVVHPFFFLVPTVAYAFLRRHLGTGIALLCAPFLWVAFEWVHSLGELAFPWLTLGNTQTYAIERIQYITVTGVYGISFWIVAINAIFYYLLMKIAGDKWKPVSTRSVLTFAVLVLLVLLPGIHGRIVLTSADSSNSGKSIQVGIIQPNIDPWKKWEVGPSEQLENFLNLSQEVRQKKPDLIIWPETAVSFRILTSKFTDLFQRLKASVDTVGLPLLTGFAETVFYENGKAPAGSKVIQGTSVRYDDFNAIMLLEPRSDRIQKYAKMRLVPFGERVPYAEQLAFLVEAVKWNVGISGWGIGRDTTVFMMNRGDLPVRFSAMVCYESIYPDLVASFVRKGAQLLVVVTNDSWYGNTSGPYQHAQYAVLRAIENRRSIARCANGGVSCLIDPYGRMSEARGMFTKASIVGNIGLSDEETFYSRHGDLFAKGCAGVGAFAVIAAAVSRRVRKGQR